MAACESLPNFLEKPLPEINPTTLRQSLSQCKHFNSLEEHPSLSSSSSSSSSASPTSSSSWTSSSFSSSSFSIDFISPLLANENLNHNAKNENKHCRHGHSFSSMNSCAEDISDASNKRYRKAGRCIRSHIRSHSTNEYESICESLRSKRSQITGEEFPPPIPSIGRSGKPWVSLRSYKQNGRFILKEVRIPIQEFLHACREDGRLKMQIIQSDEEEDYSDESDQRCDRCSNSDEEYNGQKDLGDEEGTVYR